MRFLKYNRTAAWIALVFCVAFALLFGVWRSVSALADKTERIYTEDNARYGSAAADIAKMTRYGRELLAIADSVLGGAADLQATLDILNDTMDSPIRQGDAVAALHAAASMAYNKILQAENATEQQRNSAISYFYEITSTLQRLASNNDYSDIAKKYNRACSVFPGNLTGFEKAATYN